MIRALKHVLSAEAFLAFENTSPDRHEFVSGEVFLMTGGTQRHNRIALNLATALLTHLAGKPCQVFFSDVKLRVERADAYYYPDVMVACGPQHAAANEALAVHDPKLLIEVISPSTETIDRREKLLAYRQLPSLSEYVLVGQERRQVEIYRRDGDIAWRYFSIEESGAAEFGCVDLQISLEQIYAGTDVPAAPP